MKYCLSNRQETSYLNKADEIKVDFRDKNSIVDLIEKYPDKTIIVMCYDDAIINWNEVNMWKVLSHNKLIMCLASVSNAKECKEKGIPFYMGYPVKTFYELNSLKNYGVCYVRLAEPLFFEMDKVKKVGIPVRVVPNVAYIDGIPREDGVCGSWLRPEDVDTYEPYVDVLEFEDCTMEKEQALFRIYAEQKRWPGSMSLLFTNFKHEGTNRLILPEVAQKRLNCGQRCQSGGACKICYRALNLAMPEKIRNYMEATDQS